MTSFLNHREQLRSRLQNQLQAGNFHLFAAVCQDVLQAIGCSEVRFAGRLSFKGKNRDGGHDLEATLPGPSPRTVVVQLKQFRPKQRVFQRTVDELRGVALRAGASEAILITSGSLSQALQADSAATALLPVRAVDGQELLDLLIIHGLGVVEIEGRLVFDERYFAQLAQRCRNHGQQEPYRSQSPKKAPKLLTIQVQGYGDYSLQTS